MMSGDDRFTPISEIGEFGLIERIAGLLPHVDSDVVIGIGDDAAAIRVSEQTTQVVTTDALIEHVHFDRTYTPMRHLGYKAVAVNVSDITAMNAVPSYVTAAIGLPNSVSIEMVEALYAGIGEAALDYGLAVVGGDTTASQRLVLAMTAFGQCDEERLVRRSGAAPGDLICVSGPLGSSYAGLRILQHHKQLLLEEGEDYSPDLTPFETVIGRHLRPRARTDIIQRFRDLGLTPTSMIDLSDGLASDIRHVCAQSGCGATVNLSSLPALEETRETARMLAENVEAYMLRGGEDYELLFTLRPADQGMLADLDGVTVIGVCTSEDEGVILDREGTREDLGDVTFAHF